MVDVFISYQRQERDAVAIVAEKLRALKFEVWFDEALRAGGSYDEEIASNLKAAKAVLVCWTPAAIASEWVRAEAAMAHNDGRLLAAFLEPTELIPPFNLVHAENLMTWAGQEDDEGWLGLLARIGELAGRPGVTTYYRAMRPEATAAELRAWAQANGADPLAENVWARVALIEGESGANRIAREKAEARTRDIKRAENAARSKALAKARGLRDPKEQGRRLLRVTAALVLVGVLAGAGFGYSLYSNDRLRTLDRTQTVEDVRSFLAKNPWGPINAEAMKKFYEIDLNEWGQIKSDGSFQAYEEYIEVYSKSPQGRFLEEAKKEATAARNISLAQRLLTRLRLYDGETNGTLDEKTYGAVTLFQYRAGALVNGDVNAALIAQLEKAVQAQIALAPGLIPPGRVGRPTEDEYRQIAARLKVDGPTLKAIYRLESGNVGGFDKKGRITNRFHPYVFSDLTKHKYDAVAPRVSNPVVSSASLPKTQDESWSMLSEAAKLDSEAAYKATAFGAYLIMGRNHQALGFDTASEYAQFAAMSEANQFETFVRFINSRGLLKPLQNQEWEAFAKGYNGGAQVNEYARRLRETYAQAAAEFGTARPTEGATIAAAAPVASPAPAARVVEAEAAPVGAKLPTDEIFIPRLGEAGAPIGAVALTGILSALAFALCRRRARLA